MSSSRHSQQQPKRQQRLRTQLLVVFLILILLPTIALIIVTDAVHTAREREGALNQLDTLAGVQVGVLETWARDKQTELENMASDPLLGSTIGQLTVIPPGSDPAAETTARVGFAERAHDIIALAGSYDRVILVNNNGVLLASNDNGLAATSPDFSGESWLQAAIKDPDKVTSLGPVTDPYDKLESFYFAVSIQPAGAATPIGVLCGRVLITSLQAVLLDLPFEGEAGGDYFLVREGRRYVLPPQQTESSALASSEIVTAALKRENGSGEWTDQTGRRVYGVYRWIEPLQMSLVVIQSTEGVAAEIWDVLQSQLAIAGVVALLAILLAIFFARRIVAPVERLNVIAMRAAEGDLSLQATPSNSREFSQLASSFNHMTSQLHAAMEQQSQAIATRTLQLEITSQIGHVLATETDVDRLFKVTVNMIRDQLGYYHAQIFILDDLHQFAVLQTSSGSAGQELIAQGYKLEVGSQSVIGQATQKGEPILVRDTDNSPIYRRHELLPGTRAELALPLRVGDQVIGGLDVHSDKTDAFDEATIKAFQTVADQLAVAIRSAQLFHEKEGLLSASLQLTQTLTRENWDVYLAQRKASPDFVGYKYDLSDVHPLSQKEGEDGGDGKQMNLPIALRGEVIGELAAQMPPGQDMSDDDKQLVGQVLDRVALALDNARLFEQTQISLMETNRLYEASQQIAAADSVSKLTDVLLGVMQPEGIDRAVVLLFDEPGEMSTGQWLYLLGRWASDPADQVLMLPERMTVEQFPLLLEYEPDAMGGGLIINNTDNASLEENVRETLKLFGVQALAEFPVSTGGRTLGWMLLHSLQRPDVFNEADKRFFEAIADQAATAMEGLRLYSEAQARVRRLQAVNEVSRAASSILNPDILLPLTVEKISEAFGYYHAQIFLTDETGEWAKLRASTGEVGHELLQRGHKLGIGTQSVLGQVMARGEPVIARDTDTDPTHRRNELLPNTRAEMAVPLRTGDRVIGALDVQSTQVNAFDTEAQVILQSLADQISVTLENAQLFQEIQDRVAELTTVNLISQAVSRAETLNDLYDVVASQLQHTFGARYGFLAVSAEKDMIHLPIFMENGQRVAPIGAIPVGQGLTNHVLKSREVLLINENVLEVAQRLDAQIGGTIPKSLLAVPLLLGDEIIGVISIQDPDKERAYNETHVRQLTTLAAYISVKIRNAELLEEAQRRAAELGFLFNITRAAVATTELDEALTNVTNILLTDVPGVEAAMVYLASSSEGMLETHASVGFGRDITARYPQIEMGETMVGIAASEGTPLILTDVQAEPRYADFDERIQSALVVPLKAGTESIGVLTLASSEKGVFGNRELRLLEAASGTLTAIIQSSRLLEQITQANEQLRELDKLKSQFLANMSHELRTPLNSIIGFSRVMLKGIDGQLNDLQTQDLTTIYQSGQHLLGLINDILDISKIESGKMEIQPDYISLEEIIDGVMASGKGLIKDKPIQIFKEVEANLPKVYGDPVRVRGVMLNLVSNASKFTHEGDITIRAAHRNYDTETAEPARVQIDVVDTGIGIAQEDFDKLFKAFSQVDGTTTRHAGGTGLGLAISKQFVEMHGGRMWLESQKGAGSTFSFTIPLHPPKLETSDVFFVPQQGDDRPVVLAVDDEPGVLDLYSRYLEKRGYAVVGLSNASDLLNRVREYQPMAILLDLNLPDVDGWSAIDQLKLAEDTRNVPIVICSIEDARQRASELGVTEYLVKPIIEEDLLEALNRAMGGLGEKVLSILIVDGDEQYARTVQETLLVTQRYNASVVGIGLEGLQVIHEHRPDMVIIDLDLSDMDGYGLLTSLRTQDETRNLPTLILTTREVTGDELERLGVAVTGYLNKSDATQEQVLAALAAVWESCPKPD